MTRYVIYVPGLGDATARGQALVVRWWRLFGVQGVFVPMRWADNGEPWEAKFQRLLDTIDELSQKGSVSLVGSSAGASPVLLAYAKRPAVIQRVVCICGKVNRPAGVNPAYFAKNPAFKEAIFQMNAALPSLTPAQRANILSLHPLLDEIVAPKDTLILGAHNRTTPTIGHAVSIGLILTVGAPYILRFVKQVPAIAK